MTEAPNQWGRWGAEDERGALNLLTPEVVASALRAPRTGRAYALGIPIQRTGIPNFEYRGIPQRLTLANHADEQQSRANGGVAGVGANEDMLVMASHTATHLDALCHVYADHAIYNGFAHDAVTPYTGAPRCSIDKVGAIAGRGVLIDVAAQQGVNVLEPGYIITPDDLRASLDAQGIALRPGDLVLVRTGWVDSFMAGHQQLRMQPGIGLDAAIYLAEQDVAMIGADNSAVEAMPFDRDVYLVAHIELLVRRGIHLLENLTLAELSADRCYEFLLCIGALKITGATGSPVNPIAIG